MIDGAGGGYDGAVGWNFGGAVIDFDFASVLDELGERRRKRPAPMLSEDDDDPNELFWMDAEDAGVLAFEALGVSAVPRGPLHFEEASSRSFDGLAFARIAGKTVLLGRRIGMFGDNERCKEASRRRGPVLVFWINEASDSYLFSYFRDGARVRSWSRGEGMNEEDGEPLPGEPGDEVCGCDHILDLSHQLFGVGMGEMFDAPFQGYRCST